MSLSAHERHQLEEIEHALHHQHPDLDELAERLGACLHGGGQWPRSPRGPGARSQPRRTNPDRLRPLRAVTPSVLGAVVLRLAAAALLITTVLVIVFAVLTAAPVLVGAALRLGGLCFGMLLAEAAAAWARATSAGGLDQRNHPLSH